MGFLLGLYGVGGAYRVLMWLDGPYGVEGVYRVFVGPLWGLYGIGGAL